MESKQTIFIGKNFLGSMIRFLKNRIDEALLNHTGGFTPTPTLSLLRSVFDTQAYRTLFVKRFTKGSFVYPRNKNTMTKLVSGFTLVELLVTISIFVILTGVVLFNQNNFDNSVLLNNLAYDTALTIRQAQSYGVNTKESNISGTFSSFGVYYDRLASNTNFVLFADTNNSSTTASVTTCPSSDPECVQKYSMKRGSFIKSMCAGTDIISNCIATDKLSIIFKRPNPDAWIYAVDNLGTLSLPKAYAKITVPSAAGTTKNIIISSAGQIYVQK